LILVKSETQSATKQQIGSPEESASIDLFRTADLLSRAPAQVLKGEDLSPTQYNVLRILRGAPSGLPCGEIAGRMITRDPDITRLLDRLAKRGLIARRRESKDRRIVLTKITPEGLDLLGRLDAPMQQVHHKQLGHLGPNRLTTLAQLLESARSELA
jgi:DNA-binding MarR family transcriptional regulator